MANKISYDLVVISGVEKYRILDESRRIDLGFGESYIPARFIDRSAGDKKAFIPLKGKCFHKYDGCSKTTGVKEETTIIDAISKGYAHCSHCFG